MGIEDFLLKIRANFRFNIEYTNVKLLVIVKITCIDNYLYFSFLSLGIFAGQYMC